VQMIRELKINSKMKRLQLIDDYKCVGRKNIIRRSTGTPFDICDVISPCLNLRGRSQKGAVEVV